MGVFTAPELDRGVFVPADLLWPPSLRDQAPALLVGDRTITHNALSGLVGDRLRELDLPDRSLVVLSGETGLDWIVTYLALLAGRHVPLLVPAHDESLAQRWQAAASIDVSGSGIDVDRHDRTAPTLDDELALLMSTSGSTGSPKLIRLSARNLAANARSIVELQALTPADRGITSLPLHYSFGLSVLHSHLAVGASLVVTPASVVDRCFADAAEQHRITNLAGVPHTFDLLEQAGPERIAVGSLRFLAQAGGRMAPERTRNWAQRAEAWGVDWFTMYGQTEATARIAYVPPRSAVEHAGSVGIAVPGGSIRIDRPDHQAIGEVVYSGPNVMMGYAGEPDDLALDATLDELRTGDLGRIDPGTGMLTIVGRSARRIKPFGFRIDLDDLERRLAGEGIDADVVGDDELVVASAASHRDADVVGAIRRVAGLPARSVAVLAGAPPRTPSGKIDAPAMLARARAERDATVDALPASGRDVTRHAPSATGDTTRAVGEAMRNVLGLASVDEDDTFVALGGDSLSYIECSLHLERILGGVPPGWHLMTVAELGRHRDRRRWARLDTTVALRAIGILAVVSTHMRLRHVPGGAHLMLGVVGYNFARFLLPLDGTAARLRAGVRTVGRVAVPTLGWTALLMIPGFYTWSTLTLVNNYVGPRSHAGNHWHFWFVEVFVHLVLAFTLLSIVPAFRRFDAGHTYLTPLLLLAATIPLRMDWADLGDWYNLRFRTHAVAWFFVLGWLVFRSSNVTQRCLTTALCVATAPGVFQNPRREFFIAAGLVLLVWCRNVVVPRWSVRPVAAIASASMWILISHFVIWPPLADLFVTEVAYPLTVLASMAVWWTVTRLTDSVRQYRRSARRTPVLRNASLV